MKKISIIRLGAIGDVILTSPVVLNLKISFPEAAIYFLTRPRTAGILKQFAGVDEILEFPHDASFMDLFRFGESLDSMGFDAVLDLHGNIRSKYLMKHITAPIKVQYPKRRLERIKAVQLKRIAEDPPHTIDLYNKVVKECGGQIYARRPILQPIKRRNVTDPVRQPPTIAIAPGASYRTKQWFPDRFRALVMEIFARTSAKIVLILADSDREMASLKREIPAERLEVVIDSELGKLSGIISGADLLVCNDSALSHLGSSVGTPALAIFGPTHPTLGFAPRGLNDAVIQANEFCRPCSLHGKRPCYRDRQYCFDMIMVDDVMAKIAEMMGKNAKGEKAIFIDRDGTLIKEKGYLSNPDDIEVEYKAYESISMARQAGFKIIIISNQSGVARGRFAIDDVERVNRRMTRIFADNNAPIDDIFYCPHFPGGTVAEYSIPCDCRKPSPGMIEKACRRHNINPFNSYVVGDKLSDVNLAHVTGCRPILVRTGFGKDDEKLLQYGHRLKPETVQNNLHEAVKYIMGL